MRLHSRCLRHLAAAFGIALVLAGCSSLPTAPESAPRDNAALASAGDGERTSIRTPDSGAAPLATTTTTIVRSATASKKINGLLGGTVTAGDFTVIIPPLAITGTATVTVSQPDVTKPVVDLSINPGSANKFNLPVTLLAKASKVSPSLLSVSYLSWYNPATGQWVKVPGSTVSVLNLTVQAPLWHFSKYRVEVGGKAGW